MLTSPDPRAQRAAREQLDSIEKEKSVLLAAELRTAALLGQLWGDDDGVVLEVAGTAKVGQARAGTTLSRGERMVALFPIALGLLESGAMRVGTVDIVLQVSSHASRAVQAELDRRCSTLLCTLDAADARKLVARTVLEVEAELDAAEQRQRHEQALADRFVSISPTRDGMARVTADLGVLQARRFGLDLEELVRAQKVLDDQQGIGRTQAQRRADVFSRLPSLLLAVANGRRTGRLTDLLPDQLLAHLSTPASATGSDGPNPAGEPPLLDTLSEDPALIGTDELPLGLPARTAPPCWQHDPDALLTELLNLPVHNPVTMYVHTAMSTQLELDQRTGWLEGVGPISALHARILLPSADLRRVAVDDRTGVPLGIDIPANTPWFDTCTWTFETESIPVAHGPDQPPPDDPPSGSGGDDPGGGGGSPGSPPSAPHGAPTARREQPGSSDRPNPSPAPTPDTPAPDTADPASPAATDPPVADPTVVDPAAAGLRLPSEQALRQRARLLNLLRPMIVEHRTEPRHDPSTALRELTRVRDMTCDGPGCPRTARNSELDHEHDHATGGVTAIWNLKHRSPRCHHAKHRDWTVEHDRSTGASTWTSPIGSSYPRAPFWPTPTPLPPDATLPTPRLEAPLTVRGTQHHDLELPLWHEPLPAGALHGRTLNPDDLPDPDPTPPRPGSLTARAQANQPPSTWNDGPPPF